MQLNIRQQLVHIIIISEIKLNISSYANHCNVTKYGSGNKFLRLIAADVSIKSIKSILIDATIVQTNKK